MTEPHIASCLAAIAATTLGIPTLEIRGSDELDFHALSVWQIARALREAYESGRHDEEGGAA